MTAPTRNVWLVARLVGAAGVATVAILFLSSWALAILVGGVTIAAVAVDGWLLSRGGEDQVAIDLAPTPTPAHATKLTVDLFRHRR